MRFVKKSSSLLVFSCFVFDVSLAQIQGSSGIPCDPKSSSSPTNCDYAQYDTAYSSRSQIQKDAAWDMIPGQTCGVLDPTERPGTQTTRSSYNMQRLEAQLSAEIKDKLFGSKNKNKPKKTENSGEPKKEEQLSKEEQEERRKMRQEKRKKMKQKIKNNIQKIDENHPDGKLEENLKQFMAMLQHQLENIEYRELQEDAPDFDYENYDTIKSREKRLTKDDHSWNNFAYDGTNDHPNNDPDNNDPDTLYTAGPSVAIDNTDDSASPWLGKFVGCYETYSDTPNTCDWKIHSAKAGYANSVMISPNFHLTPAHVLKGKSTVSVVRDTDAAGTGWETREYSYTGPDRGDITISKSFVRMGTRELYNGENPNDHSNGNPKASGTQCSLVSYTIHPYFSSTKYNVNGDQEDQGPSWGEHWCE